ncbi:MAG TPA: leucine-rich repeat domain-containing protein, partial [Firmicutes bacterium]|nr:leucine-rich repeat domain-containing protein [Bacillota bacterium]
MKKLRKRVISMLLVVVLAVSLLPAGAFAEYVPPDGADSPGFFALGNSGLEYALYTRFDYIFDDEGKPIGTNIISHIVIRPSSDADDATFIIPDNAQDLYWQPSETSLYQQVYIEAGVKGIGANAFADMEDLDQITIEAPEQLTHIGENAFTGGGRSGGVQFITGSSEEEYDDSGSLDLSNVETIGANAFNGCSQLEKVTLGNDLTAIESGEPTEHKIADGAFAGTGLTEITIPENVTAIGDSAFANPSGDGFPKLVIPENVTDIGESAFSGHGLLGTVEIYAGQNGAITVGDNAFANCGTEAGTDITGYTDEDLEDWDFKTGKLPEDTGTPFNNVRPLFLFQHDINMPANLSALEGKSPPDGVSAMYLSSKSTAADCTTPGYNGYVFYKEDDIDGDKYNYVEILPALGHQ